MGSWLKKALAGSGKPFFLLPKRAHAIDPDPNESSLGFRVCSTDRALISAL